MTPDEISRRAGGRRRHNAQRAIAAAARRQQVAALLGQFDRPFAYGTRAVLARRLGVSRATICRDLQVLAGLAGRRTAALAEAETPSAP
jgi:hypothetical protein